jgi:DNA-binding PadR family transcriptional regulator
VADELSSLGRYSGPATLILSSLADGPKHGYSLTKDIEGFARIYLAPGTLYAALDRLVELRLIEGLEPVGRRRPYKLTALGATTLKAHLEEQRTVIETGLRRLTGAWAAS